MNAQELIQRVAAYKPADDQRSPLEITCWFVAIQEAGEVAGSYSTKDLARILLDGLPLGGPFRDEDDLQSWVEFNDDSYDHDPLMWAWLDDAIRDFWGVRR